MRNVKIWLEFFFRTRVGLGARQSLMTKSPGPLLNLQTRLRRSFKYDIPNQFLITDPTICQPGFDLKGSDWTLLNRYRKAVVQLLYVFELLLLIDRY